MSSANTSRVPAEHAFIGKAIELPTTSPEPFISYGPMNLSAPNRVFDIQLKVSAPAVGDNLPIVLFSHGGGGSNYLDSLNGYGPLVSFWASHGFVVIQPTHLSSKSIAMDPKVPGAPFFWESRAEDMTYILDHLDEIESTVPTLKGRLDRNRVAMAGHSFGGHTTQMLLGTTTKNSKDGDLINQFDSRFKAGIILAGTGNGDVVDAVAEKFPFFKHTDFSNMRTPALVVVGDEDSIPYLTPRGPSWHFDSYTLSPGPKTMLTLKGCKHGLGGVAGFDAKETDDESVEVLGIVQRMTVAYLRNQLYGDDGVWTEACEKVKGLGELARVESK